MWVVIPIALTRLRDNLNLTRGFVDRHILRGWFLAGSSAVVVPVVERLTCFVFGTELVGSLKTLVLPALHHLLEQLFLRVVVELGLGLAATAPRFRRLREEGVLVGVRSEVRFEVVRAEFAVLPPGAGQLVGVFPIIGEVVEVSAVGDQDDLDVLVAVGGGGRQVAGLLAQEAPGVARAEGDGLAGGRVAVVAGLDVPSLSYEGEVGFPAVLGASVLEDVRVGSRVAGEIGCFLSVRDGEDERGAFAV